MLNPIEKFKVAIHLNRDWNHWIFDQYNLCKPLLHETRLLRIKVKIMEHTCDKTRWTKWSGRLTNECPLSIQSHCHVKDTRAKYIAVLYIFRPYSLFSTLHLSNVQVTFIIPLVGLITIYCCKSWMLYFLKEIVEISTILKEKKHLCVEYIASLTKVFRPKRA